MRQILYGEHWIHPEEPQEIRDIFIRKGKFTKFRTGTKLLHGGPNGQITLITKGICLYRFEDWQDRTHIFSLIVPNRVAGDIDAACCNVANVDAVAMCSCEGYVLPYEVWHREIYSDLHLLQQFTTNVIKKQECHIEALLACFTMEIDMRLRSFLRAFISAYTPPKLDGWNKIPVRLSTTLIAEIISASRTSVSLILSQWSREELLYKKGNALYIHGRAFHDLSDWWI